MAFSSNPEYLQWVMDTYSCEAVQWEAWTGCWCGSETWLRAGMEDLLPASKSSVSLSVDTKSVANINEDNRNTEASISLPLWSRSQLPSAGWFISLLGPCGGGTQAIALKRTTIH